MGQEDPGPRRTQDEPGGLGPRLEIEGQGPRPGPQQVRSICGHLCNLRGRMFSDGVVDDESKKITNCSIGLMGVAISIYRATLVSHFVVFREGPALVLFPPALSCLPSA